MGASGKMFSLCESVLDIIAGFWVQTHFLGLFSLYIYIRGKKEKKAKTQNKQNPPIRFDKF